MSSKETLFDFIYYIYIFIILYFNPEPALRIV